MVRFTHLLIEHQAATMTDTKHVVEVPKHDPQDIPMVAEAHAGVLEDALDPVYDAKARVLNKAIQDIGMGKYQWQVSRPPPYVGFVKF